jgi:hypothetical protein
VTRLLIGVFEAGFYPTAVAYLALFYYPFDLGVRIAVFYGLYVVANAFSAGMGKCASPNPRVILTDDCWGPQPMASFKFRLEASNRGNCCLSSRAS